MPAQIRRAINDPSPGVANRFVKRHVQARARLNGRAVRLVMVHQPKCDFTSGLFKTTSAQMPRGSPNRQQGEMHGTMAIMLAVSAN